MTWWELMDALGATADAIVERGYEVEPADAEWNTKEHLDHLYRDLTELMGLIEDAQARTESFIRRVTEEANR